MALFCSPQRWYVVNNFYFGVNIFYFDSSKKTCLNIHFIFLSKTLLLVLSTIYKKKSNNLLDTFLEPTQIIGDIFFKVTCIILKGGSNIFLQCLSKYIDWTFKFILTFSFKINTSTFSNVTFLVKNWLQSTILDLPTSRDIDAPHFSDFD